MRHFPGTCRRIWRPALLAMSAVAIAWGLVAAARYADFAKGTASCNYTAAEHLAARGYTGEDAWRYVSDAGWSWLDLADHCVIRYPDGAVERFDA